MFSVIDWNSIRSNDLHVRRKFIDVATAILGNCICTVDWQLLVRINGNDDIADVSLPH